jgi:hypothetical protein
MRRRRAHCFALNLFIHFGDGTPIADRFELESHHWQDDPQAGRA